MRHVLITGDTNHGSVSASITLILRQHGCRALLFKESCGIASEVFVLADGSEVDTCFGNYERILNTAFTRSSWINSISDVGGENADVLVIETEAGIGPQDSEGTLRVRCVRDGEKTLVQMDSFCFPLKGGSVYKIPFLLESQGFFNVLQRLLHCNSATRGELCDDEPWVRGTSSAGDMDENILRRKQGTVEHPDTPVSSPECEDYTVRADVHRAPAQAEDLDRLLAGREEKALGRVCADVARYSRTVRVGIVGKFTKEDAYLSLSHALDFSAHRIGVEIEKTFLDAEDCELDGVDCIVVPGGFGKLGVEGKIRACRYARERGVPFLGICLGMQTSVIDVARHLLGLRHASSQEFGETPHPVVASLGRRRLGDIEVSLQGRVKEIYRTSIAVERHRHEFGVNAVYLRELEKHLELSCTEGVVETAVLRNHVFHVSVQYHPEFLARPDAPHPLITELIKHALNKY